MKVKELKKEISKRRKDIRFIQKCHKKCPFAEKILINTDFLEKDIEILADELIKIPIIPGKFLELPNDCYYEIAKYFENTDEFIMFSLVSSSIKLDKFVFKNVGFILRRTGYYHIDSGECICDINHGKIYVKKYTSFNRRLSLLHNIITVNLTIDFNFTKLYSLWKKINCLDKLTIKFDSNIMSFTKEIVMNIINKIDYYHINANIIVNIYNLYEKYHYLLCEYKDKYIDIYKLADLMNINIPKLK